MRDSGGVVRSEVRTAVRRLEEIERGQILEALKQTSWRIEGPSGAAEILKLKPSTLRSRMQKLEIRRSTQVAL
jgi:transcriptional regulator with GAF, ATPase, and Fis domain